MIKTKNLKFMNFIEYPDILIEKNTVNFLVGPSGCGKSTLLKIFNATANPSAGKVYYNEKLLDEYDTIKLRKEIKLISQTPFLFAETIKENFVSFNNYCDCKITEEEMKKYLNICEANFDLDKNCDSLSGGEKQRVYIAICLSMPSNVIMLDEPTSALDKEVAQRVLSNIIEFAKEKTLIIISHDKDIVDKFAKNIILLGGDVSG